MIKVIFAASALLGAMPALSWGPDAHRVTGAIAWEYLSEEARNKTARLLQAMGEDNLAEAGTWADRIRSDANYDWAAPLHYINLPVQWSGYDAERDCPEKGCILRAIDRYRARLADKRLSERERGEALLFLIHFVEDVHQPMHTGLREDRGGNDVKLTFFGDETNLHALWDTQLPARFIDDWQAYAAEQPAQVGESEQAEWVKSTPADWAAESHALAHSNAYVSGRELGQAYLETNRPVVEQRLRQGGVRLAAMIEKALSSAN